MKLLIQWKDTGEEAIKRFGILDEGQISPNAQQIEDEGDIFYWLTTEEATAIGADYDGGDWFVVCCACEECESERYAESFIE